MTRTAAGHLQPSSPRLRSKGLKQRTHFVELRNEGLDIYVADSAEIAGASTLASDVYAFRPLTIPTAAKKGEIRMHSRFE